MTFLKKSSLFFLVFSLFFIFSGFAEPLQGDGFIRIYNYHLDEFAEIQFRKNGEIISKEIEKFNHLLRSRESEEIKKIDLRLVDLLDYLQDYFKVDTLEIISGYRTKEFNNELVKTGHSVSPISLHTQGKAIDIHIDEIREETLRDYLLQLKTGGVGYYASLDFIHVDFGPVRSWSEGGKNKRKLVGLIDSTNSLQLISDKNDYLSNETIKFDWTISQSQFPILTLEHFFRGKWNQVGTFQSTQKKWELSSKDPIFKNKNGSECFGKYRWIFEDPTNKKTISSNEFYLKKK